MTDSRFEKLGAVLDTGDGQKSEEILKKAFGYSELASDLEALADGFYQANEETIDAIRERFEAFGQEFGEDEEATARERLPFTDSDAYDIKRAVDALDRLTGVMFRTASELTRGALEQVESSGGDVEDNVFPELRKIQPDPED